MNMDYKKALDFMIEQCTYQCSHEEGAAIDALTRRVPIKPFHMHEEYSEHLWRRDKNGEIDTSAWSAGYCNGPVCTRCWHSECEFCNPEWETDPYEPCVVDKDICLECGSEVKNKHKYCPECGQALDWSKR
jgi:hypothetical protein